MADESGARFAARKTAIRIDTLPYAANLLIVRWQ
jgi:hypothetical protein